MHNPSDLIELFNDLFKKEYQTILTKGTSEPIYRIRTMSRKYNEIVFAHGFFSSALHEIAHWCVAGRERREKEDYGYWYSPDGRSKVEQEIFFKVEIKPQAIEWILSQAAGYNFQFSADNLNSEVKGLDEFILHVQGQVLHYIDNGLPKRAEQIIEKLSQFYKTYDVLNKLNYQLEKRRLNETTY